MENPTLKELLLGLEKKMRQLQIAKQKVDRPHSGGHTLHYDKWAVEQHEQGVKYYQEKIKNFGSGVIIEVTGKAWTNHKDLEVPMPFTMYLNCKDEDEANLLLQVEISQVPDNILIWETLKFRTIKLKTINFHT